MVAGVARTLLVHGLTKFTRDLKCHKVQAETVLRTRRWRTALMAECLSPRVHCALRLPCLAGKAAEVAVLPAHNRCSSEICASRAFAFPLLLSLLTLGSCNGGFGFGR